jgi:serine protease AprX
MRKSVNPLGRRLHRAVALLVVSSTLFLGGAAPAQASVPTRATPVPAKASGLLGGLLGPVGGLLGGLLSGVVGVVTTAADTTLGLLTGADWGYSSGQTTMTQVNQAVGATGLHNSGVTGKGVGVALVDTGVVPIPGLTSGNVVNGPDLSLDNGSATQGHLDGFGHGTHMAGIIAGNDGTKSGFTGVAPGATLVNVKTGASSGAVDVSQVIAAIDWVVQHRNDPGLNIRVLNLSYGTDGTQPYASDPLAAAVERAWRAGIVVVVAGGNSGSDQPSLDNPATDPYVIAVGADDTNGTTSSLDDTVPVFSSQGSSSRHVDLVAPGQSIVSLRDPGSVIDTEYPKAVVDSRYFKGSGTSQAAAVVSGAAALLLQQRPSLTPDQVKALLVDTASPMPKASASSRGAGLLNVAAASLAPIGAVKQTWPASSGLGSLEAARGDDHISDNNVDLTGEQDVFGSPWSAAGWSAASSSGSAWSGGVFHGSTWAGGCWCGVSWTPRTWSDVSWQGADWAGTPWLSHSWSAEAWSSHSWSGSGWVSHSWSSHSWSGSSW